jgi:branched-chain amino acid transport system substrate-binding protein
MRSSRIGSLVVVVGVVAAACGGDGSGSATGATVDQGIQEGVQGALSETATTGTSTPEQPQSIEAWEARWAEERAAVVARIEENGWGVSPDGATLTGPEGFTIDLAACAAGWSDTEGLTDTTIRIGQTLPLSGPAADYGYEAKGIGALLQHHGEAGAFTDSSGKTRTVEYIIKDDAYDTARTIPLVDELIDSHKVFNLLTLGSPPTLKTYDKLNQRCIPQVPGMPGHPALGDPVGHPWTTTSLMAYNTEAVLWGGFIEQRLDEFGDGPVKVASLYITNDFGSAYDSAFRAYLADSGLADRVEYVSQSVEASAPTIKDAMTTLAAEEPDVFLAMTTGTACTQAVTEAAENGMKDAVPYKFMSSVCKGSGFIGRDKVGGDGSATEGWWVVGGGVKDLQSPAYDSDAYIAWAREMLAGQGIDHRASGSIGLGLLHGWIMAQALQIAGELEGGLTRSNLILAARTMDMSHPMLLPGVRLNMDGNADAYFIEGSEFGRYDAATQNWIPQGAIIDLSGRSANCRWDQARSACS